MHKSFFALAIALIGGPAMADPLTDAMTARDGILCFTRSYDAAWLKAHRGQTLREVTLAISDDPDSTMIDMRLGLRDDRRALYGFGQCWWAAGDLNRGVHTNILDPAFKPTTGVGCHMVTDITGGSAEEGSEPLVDWRDGRTIEVHLGDSLAMWTSHDISRPAKWHALKRGDRIVRLNRAPASKCRALIDKFAPGGLG